MRIKFLILLITLIIINIASLFKEEQEDYMRQ
jgi:hypothetical protein